MTESSSRWVVEPSNCRADWKCHAAYILVSASTNFTFQWCCCSNRFDRYDRHQQLSWAPLAVAAHPGRRFTCKLIFNPNTANSLYGTALTLLSQQQVDSELRALWSQLSFRLVSCFFPFGFCISLPFWLLCKFTYNSNDHNTLRLSFTKHVYGLWNLLLSLSLEQMWVLLYYVFFWVWFWRVFIAWLQCTIWQCTICASVVNIAHRVGNT